MQKTEISWTDMSWNPVRGCTRISAGCTRCYAEIFAERWRGIPGHPYEQGFDLRLVPEKLQEPLRWRKPKRIFVNSMSDLFHEEVPGEYVAATFASMVLADWHIYQVLTKRAERMEEWISSRMMAHPHIWLGVSVENRKQGLPRIDHLRNTPAAVRFLSVEPLLEDLGEIDLTGIHWVIVGGESGPKARPMHPDWARSIRDQCRDAGIPFFFKQWGKYGPTAIRLDTGLPTFRTFRSFDHWVAKGRSWVYPGDACVDTRGRICKRGGDLRRAEEEGAFPVVTMRKSFPETRRLDGVPHDEMPEWTAAPFPGIVEQRARQTAADSTLSRARTVARGAGWQPGEAAEAGK